MKPRADAALSIAMSMLHCKGASTSMVQLLVIVYAHGGGLFLMIFISSGNECYDTRSVYAMHQTLS